MDGSYGPCIQFLPQRKQSGMELTNKRLLPANEMFYKVSDACISLS